MIEAYLAGATLEQAAALFGYSLSTCRNILFRHNVPIRSFRVPLEHEESIKAAYLAGASAKEAVAPFGYSDSTCLKILHRNGIPVRIQQIPPEHEEAIVKAYQEGATAKQSAADESFFDQIDTEKKAYWLGFLTADGSVNLKNGSITLALKASDQAHIYKFAADLGSQHPVVITGLSLGFVTLSVVKGL